ncbi:MAG TPA: sigma-70 family RNA polymerase sigma factor [Sphingobium sp.]
MAQAPGEIARQGLEAVLLANRTQLLRFLAAHGAGDAAEDLLQELWLRISDRPVGPVGNALSYLYRAANNLMIDRHRAERQARLRDQNWTETFAGDEAAPDPSAEEVLISREEWRRMNATLAAVGERPAYCLRRFRLDGVSQRDIAAELGVSLSTVESDLRRAYAALLAARRQSDDA